MKAKVNKNQRGLAALVIIAVAALLLVGRIGYLQIIKGDYYSSKAESQQLSDSEIAASRGKIYDANMNVLAQSASVWKVYLNPSKINNFDEEDRDRVRGIIASGLSTILGVEEETVLKYTQKNYSFERQFCMH